MDHTSSQRPHLPLSSTSFEVSFVDKDKNDIVDGRYGPGRTVGKLLEVSGGQIDRIISKAAERVGYGPRMTAERIRRRLHIIEHSFIRYEGRRFCRRCWSNVEEFLPSPTLIKAEAEKLGKDVRRLLKYVNSNVPLTQVQAVNHILDLSFDHIDARTLFKQIGAVSIIKDLEKVHLKFRHDDGYFDNLLLSSSRKVLVSLRDAEINSLLQEWRRYIPLYLFEDEERAISLWRKIIPSLYDPEAAFLVMRTLARTDLWTSSRTMRQHVKLGVTSCMENSANYFEWEEYESVSLGIFASVFYHGERGIIQDYLRFVGNMPRVLESWPFRLLSKRVEELDMLNFHRVHMLKAALMRIVADDDERISTDIPEYLQAFRSVFNCPVERAVCEFAWNDIGFPSSLDLSLYTKVSHYIDSTDIKLRAKAWEYANYVLTCDLNRCDLMLEALSRTAFAAMVGFPAFKKTERAKHFPSKKNWTTVYRHVNEAGRICLGDLCSCSITGAEQLEYHCGWVSYIDVNSGSAVLTSDQYPLIAGHDKNRACSYVAHLRIRVFECRDCQEYLHSADFAVTEGTKPEDLRVEICCPHQKRLLIPDSIVVRTLRYPPDEYPDAFYDGDEGVDATGPFSWKPAEGHKIRRRSYTVRVLSVEEAIESGWDLDDEELGSQDDCGSTSVSTSDDSHSAFCEKVTDDGPDLELDEAGSPSYVDREDDEDITAPGSPSSRSAMSADDEQRTSDAESASDDCYDGAAVVATDESVSSENTSDEDLTARDQVDIQPGIKQECLSEVHLGPHKVGVITNGASDEPGSSTEEYKSDTSSSNETDLSEVEEKSIEPDASVNDEKTEMETDLVNTSDKSSVDVAYKGRHEVSATFTYIGATDLRLAVIMVLCAVMGAFLMRAYDSMQVQ